MLFINEDQHLVDLAQNAVKKLYGEDGLAELEKMTGSEDFAYLMEKAPGVYGFIGARSAAIPGSEKATITNVSQLMKPLYKEEQLLLHNLPLTS